MAKDLKFIETAKLTVYLELLGKMITEIQEVGVATNTCAGYGGITKEKKESIHADLFERVKLLDTKQHLILAELGRRLKEDLSLPISPTQLFNYLQKLSTDNPEIFWTKSEWEMRMGEKLKAEAAIEATGGLKVVKEETPKKKETPVAGKIWKSAKTGEFVSAKYAKENPDECYRHKLD